MSTRKDKLARMDQLQKLYYDTDCGLSESQMNEKEEIENQLAIEFMDTIKWDQLHEQIRTKLGLAKNELILNHEFKPDVRAKGRFKIEIWTNDLSHKCGILSIANIYKELQVSNFGGNYFRSTETGDEMYWFNLHISFRYLNGGSNGCDLFQTYWNLTKDIWESKL